MESDPESRVPSPESRAPDGESGGSPCWMDRRSRHYLIGSTAMRGAAFMASLIAAMSFTMMPFTFATA